MQARLCAVLFAAVAATGCADDLSPEQQQHDSELTTAQSTWSDLQLSTYSFTWHRQCYCGPETTRPIRIGVVEGEIVSAIYVDDSTDVGADVRAGLLTIEGVFDEIEDAIAGNAAGVYVQYDPQLGIPLSVGVDYNTQIADEELSLSLSDLGLSCGGPHGDDSSAS